MAVFSYWLVSVKTRNSIFSIHIKRFALYFVNSVSFCATTQGSTTKEHTQYSVPDIPQRAFTASIRARDSECLVWKVCCCFYLEFDLNRRRTSHS